jgi:hypothetical protein
MRNIFEVNDSEKSRILGLHENATKRQYLVENPITNPDDVDPETAAAMESFETFQNLDASDLGYKVYKYLYRQNNKINPEEAKQFLTTNSEISGFIENIRKQEQERGNAETEIDNVGSYLRKHKDLLRKFYDLLKSNDVTLGMTVH